MPLTNVKEV